MTKLVQNKPVWIVTNMVAHSHNELVFDTNIAVFSSFTYSSDWDGWKTCCFMTFSTVFQSYQDDEWVIMKGCVQWNPV